MLINGSSSYRGVELVVILQPDGSLACIPAWMTHEGGGSIQRSVRSRGFSLDVLRSLRAEIDALLGFLQPELEGWRKPTMTRQSKDLQPSLFEGNEAPASCWRTAQKVELAALVEALLREIAAALANGEVGDDQDHG